MEASDGGGTGIARRGGQLCRLPAALRRCHALFERLAVRGRRCRPIAPRRPALGDRHLLPPGGRRRRPAEARPARLVPHVSDEYAAGHGAARNARSSAPRLLAHAERLLCRCGGSSRFRWRPTAAAAAAAAATTSGGVPLASDQPERQ